MSKAVRTRVVEECISVELGNIIGRGSIWSISVTGASDARLAKLRITIKPNENQQ